MLIISASFQQRRGYNNVLYSLNIIHCFVWFSFKSPWFWSPKNYTDDIGGIERNATGHVVGAKAIWVQILVEVGSPCSPGLVPIFYRFKVPEDAVKVDAGGIGFEFEVADENSLNFEQHLIDLSARETGKDDITIIVFTARSFNDVSFQTIFFDVWKMLGGYVIMFSFTVMMLGKLNKTEVSQIFILPILPTFRRFVSTSLQPACSLAFSVLGRPSASCSCWAWSTTRPTTSSPSSPSGSASTTCSSSWSAGTTCSRRTRDFRCQRG